MSKVEIKYKRGGKVKTMDARYAKALVGAKLAEYVEQPKQTYQTRELKADIEKPAPKKRGPKPKVKEETDNTYSTKVMTAEE